MMVLKNDDSDILRNYANDFLDRVAYKSFFIFEHKIFAALICQR